MPEITDAGPVIITQPMEPSPIEPERAVATVAVTENESPVRRVPAPAVAPLVSAPPVLAPNPIHIAPATSPKKIIAGPRVQKPVENSRGEDALPFGETLLTGTWEWNRGRSDITLYLEERVNGRRITWTLPLGLSSEEARLLFPRGGNESAD